MEKAQQLLDSTEQGASGGARKSSSSKRSGNKKKGGSSKANDEPMDFVTQMTKQLGLDDSKVSKRTEHPSGLFAYMRSVFHEYE
jgi:hypothetical protein